MKYLELIKDLCEEHGVSGFERDVAKLIKNRLLEIAEVTIDNIGNVICKEKNKAGLPKIMIDAHLDEIGFMVSGIKGPFIKFIQIGGWWDQTLLSQKVIIKTHKGDVKGVIGAKAPHLMSPAELTKVYEKKFMFIDIGASTAEEVEKIGIRIGDPIVPDTTFEVLNNSIVMGKALDNRLGCAAFTALIESMESVEHPNIIYGVGTVQEEVGKRGATIAVNSVQPDLCIALEGGLTTDIPGCEMEDSRVVLGGGPIIATYDTSMIANPSFLNFVLDIAKENNIPVQLGCALQASTDAGEIHKSGSGVPSLVMAVPARYVHSHNALFNYNDFEKTLNLLQCITKKLDNETVQKIKKGEYTIK